MTKDNLIVTFKELDYKTLNSEPVLTVYGKVTVYQEYPTAKGGIVVYTVTTENKTPWTVKIFYETSKPELIPNGTIVRVTGDLRRNVYKDKNGNIVDKGLVIISSGDILDFETGKLLKLGAYYDL